MNFGPYSSPPLPPHPFARPPIHPVPASLPDPTKPTNQAITLPPAYAEHRNLWAFLTSWLTLFDRFDADRSGTISLPEFSNALVAFGYTLSAPFVALLFRSYDKRGEGAMSFDLFVQSCISLKRMTDVFKRYDDDRDGFVTLSFEEFLTGEFPGFLVFCWLGRVVGCMNEGEELDGGLRGKMRRLADSLVVMV